MWKTTKLTVADIQGVSLTRFDAAIGSDYHVLKVQAINTLHAAGFKATSQLYEGVTPPLVNYTALTTVAMPVALDMTVYTGYY